MNFMKYPTKNDISISNAVLKLAKLQNAERLELTAATGAVIVTSGRMTAKELHNNLKIGGTAKKKACRKRKFSSYL